MNTVTRCGLVLLITTWICLLRCRNGYSGLLVLDKTSYEPLVHRQNVTTYCRNVITFENVHLNRLNWFFHYSLGVIHVVCTRKGSGVWGSLKSVMFAYEVGRGEGVTEVKCTRRKIKLLALFLVWQTPLEKYPFTHTGN